MDIAAPTGAGVFTTGANNQYGSFQGTSIATPHLAGTVAVLLAYRPTYTYSQAVSAIISSGTVTDGLSQKCASSAILNCYQALIVTVPEAPTATPTAPPLLTPVVPPGELDLSTARINISAANFRSKFVVSCGLKAGRGTVLEGLPGWQVQLLIKGVSRRSRKTTATSGDVNFTVVPPRGRNYQVHCAAAVANPALGQVKNVLSKILTLPGARG